jgi:prephenate dehydratase
MDAATAPTKAIEAATPPPTPAAPVAPRYDAKAALAAASRITQADAAVIAADIAGERMKAAVVADIAADISANATRAQSALQAAIMQADEDDVEALLMAL